VDGTESIMSDPMAHQADHRQATMALDSYM
jgi:hypothetical protein